MIARRAPLMHPERAKLRYEAGKAKLCRDCQFFSWEHFSVGNCRRRIAAGVFHRITVEREASAFDVGRCGPEARYFRLSEDV
jgi:hypothetical protein